MNKQSIENLEKTAVFIGQLGALISHKRFIKWISDYNDQSFRFDWATASLHRKLIDDLTFQIRQALPYESKSDNFQKNIVDFGTLCTKLSETIIAKNDLKIFKKDRKVKVSGDSDFESIVFEFLSDHDTSFVVKDNNPNEFYVWNGVNSLMVHVRARQTLTQSTGNQDFEKLLLNINEGYLMDGYPHDLLSHDAHAIRSKKPILGIVMRKNYCSTHLIIADPKKFSTAIDTSNFDMDAYILHRINITRRIKAA